MLKNYFKIAWRNLIRQKSFSLINVLGLSIGLACCLAIGLFVLDEYSFDRFHSRYNDIYRVVEKEIQGGNLYNVAVTPGPLAPELESSFSEVQHSVRIGKTYQSVVFNTDDLKIETSQVLIVDNSFFDVFDFSLKIGNEKNALLNPEDIVITQSMAEKLFGKEWNSTNLIGKQITYNKDRILTLAGVVENTPTNSHIQFEVLMSYKFEETNSNFHNWRSNNIHTYVLLDPNTEIEEFNKKIEKFLFNYSSDTTTTLSLQPLSDIYLRSDFDFQTDWSKTGNVVYIKIFTAVGIVVLLIAIFNFMNLSTARAVFREKEIGVRKVVGAQLSQLVLQFLYEALIVSFFAMGLALALLVLFLPILNSVVGKSLEIPFSSLSFLSALGFFTLLIGILAGIYPAFYLASFKPSKVLKGVFAPKSGQQFRQTLIVVQFTFSIILIIGAITIYRQLNYLQQKELGFDKELLVNVFMKSELRPKSPLLKNELLAQSGIVSVATASGNLVNVGSSTGNIEWEGKAESDEMLLSHLNIDADFVSTAGLELVAGRNFDAAIASDSTAFILNETAARQMGWTSEKAIGKSLKFWDIDGYVIGVVKDFHFKPFTEAIEPMLFRYWAWENYSSLFVKIDGNQMDKALKIIKLSFEKFDPDNEFQFQFLDQALENQYNSYRSTAQIVLYFSILAIVVSCLGLIGLASFTAEKRSKEIGIRKVLGASVFNIVGMLSTEFVKLVLFAIFIGSPVAFWLVNKWLNEFAYKMEFEWWIVVSAGVGALLLALLTVSYESIKVAVTNPVKSLKSE
jgi:ABC-type antimicrobial peptide transport system permease subunit